MAVEPVAETSGTRVIVDEGLADLAAADEHRRRGPPGTPPKRLARALERGPATASAVSRVFSEGFQTTLSPQTKASAAFQDQTATGKLKAEMTPHDAQRMPGLHHAVVGALGGDGEAVELAREADREVADVDHLLHFAEAFGDDLAGLERDEAAEIVLGGAQLLAEQADELAAPGRGDLAPGLEGRVRPGRWRPWPPPGVVSRTWAMTSPVIGRAGRAAAGGEGALRHAEARENGAGLIRNGGGADGYGFQARGHVGSPSNAGVEHWQSEAHCSIGLCLGTKRRRLSRHRLQKHCAGNSGKLAFPE